MRTKGPGPAVAKMAAARPRPRRACARPEPGSKVIKDKTKKQKKSKGKDKLASKTCRLCKRGVLSINHNDSHCYLAWYRCPSREIALVESGDETGDVVGRVCLYCNRTQINIPAYQDKDFAEMDFLLQAKSEMTKFEGFRGAIATKLSTMSEGERFRGDVQPEAVRFKEAAFDRSFKIGIDVIWRIGRSW